MCLGWWYHGDLTKPEAIFDVLGKEYTLKGVGEPEYYLGADMKNMEKPANVFIMGSGA